MYYYKITCYGKDNHVLMGAFKEATSIEWLLKFISSHEGQVKYSTINKMIIEEISKEEFERIL